MGNLNCQSILVRSSVSNSMEMSMMRKVMMDIAVPQMTGGPLASSVEECVCPPEYSGASCEECSEGHTREEGGTCVSLEERRPTETESPPYNPRVRPMRPGRMGPDVEQNPYRQPYPTENRGYPSPDDVAMKGYPRPQPQETMKGYPRPQPPPQPQEAPKGYEVPRTPAPDRQRGRYLTPLPQLPRVRPQAPAYDLRPPPRPQAPASDLCPSVIVSVEPPEQTIAQGGGAVMRCVGGGPGDQVTWQKVGADLSAPSVTVTEDTVTIRWGLM